MIKNYQFGKKIWRRSTFYKTKKLSGNFVGVLPVIKHAIRKLKLRNKNVNFCCIFSAAPNIKFQNIIKCFSILKKNKNGFVFPATKNDNYLARSFYFHKKNLKMLNENFYKKDLRIYQILTMTQANSIGVHKRLGSQQNKFSLKFQKFLKFQTPSQ